MSSVLAEGPALKSDSDQGETAALLIGSCAPVFLVLGILPVRGRLFMYPSSSGKLKRKKNTYPLNKPRSPFSFLYNFCIFGPQKFNKKVIQLEVLGNWYMLATSKSFSCDLGRWVLCYTDSATFYFKIK